MTNSTLLTQPDLDAKLDACDAQARASIKRIYAALGATLLALEPHIQDASIRDQLQDHLVAIDEESRSLKDTVFTLTQEMTLLASAVSTIQSQRDAAITELESLNRATFGWGAEQ